MKTNCVVNKQTFFNQKTKNKNHEIIIYIW